MVTWRGRSWRVGLDRSGSRMRLAVGKGWRVKKQLHSVERSNEEVNGPRKKHTVFLPFGKL